MDAPDSGAMSDDKVLWWKCSFAFPSLRLPADISAGSPFPLCSKWRPLLQRQANGRPSTTTPHCRAPTHTCAFPICTRGPYVSHPLVDTTFSEDGTNNMIALLGLFPPDPAVKGAGTQ
ncbi:hypothetical protein N656DRAFT_781730 [Canariomyces notabilis]|uniref:Uncharacterized protein n=1 Tax=Canariomyces notabilis TaxID=2074819 RepID=A0AAN6QMZ8_9PEZI|nr:hypothetical protein N656DRAFT_781730 [Canariomyces arenarius]